MIITFVLIQLGMIILLFDLIRVKFSKDKLLYSTEDLRKEFLKKDLQILFGFFLLVIGLTLGFSNILNWLSNKVITSNDITFLITQGTDAWVVIAMMFSLGFATYIIFKISRLLFKDDADRYWIYYNRKYGFNASIILKYLSILLIFTSSILACMLLNTYVIFKSESIEINRFRSYKSDVYTYKSIRGITHFQKDIAPNGNVIDKPHYVIFFDNNTSWKTTYGGRTPSSSDDEIMKYLQEKTGIAIKELELNKK